MLKRMSKEEQNAVRPIHYLGSKLRMLETIKEALDIVDPNERCVCDLFSGSGTVARYLSSYRDVIASDIQNYSSVLCEATMSFLQTKDSADSLMTEIEHTDVRSDLLDIYGDLVIYEEKCMAMASNGDISGLYEIIEKGSIYIFLNGPFSDYTDELKNKLQGCKDIAEKKGWQVSPDSIITRYYGGLYFSYRQALEMDCIEHCVFEKSGLLRTKMLAALLSTASEVVNTVGKQFAQPLKVRDSKGQYKESLRKKILEDRGQNVYEIYRKWLEYYMNVGEINHIHQVICDDYKNVLGRLKQNEVGVVYADPPYTRYHYSRYYHVLETICLRDNPIVTTTFPNGTGGISRAIYREGRHQSPFCIKSQAEKAFDELFKGVKELDVPLVLSYSPFDPSQAVTPRLQTIDQLIGKARTYFTSVETMSPGEFTHSKLNSVDKNFESNHEAEMLIICKN